jgi:membrane-associated phospholipid phosphatase
MRVSFSYGTRDLLKQLALWVVLGLAYEAVRGTAGRDRTQAIHDGRAVIDAERRLQLLFEPRLVRLVEHAASLASIVRWSYWTSEFSVLVLAVVWSYVRHREVYARFRDAVIVANGLGLVGYVAFPTAPPRMFHGYGFTNAVSGQPSPNHPTGLLGFAANPYAAMPSIHAADALLTGVFLATLARRPLFRALWVVWPLWVCFAVVASGNHFWLDLVAGAAVAAAGLAAAQLHARAAGARPRRTRAPGPVVARPYASASITSSSRMGNLRKRTPVA